MGSSVRFHSLFDDLSTPSCPKHVNTEDRVQNLSLLFTNGTLYNAIQKAPSKDFHRTPSKEAVRTEEAYKN